MNSRFAGNFGIVLPGIKARLHGSLCMVSLPVGSASWRMARSVAHFGLLRTPSAMAHSGPPPSVSLPVGSASWRMARGNGDQA